MGQRKGKLQNIDRVVVLVGMCSQCTRSVDFSSLKGKGFAKQQKQKKVTGIESQALTVTVNT